MSFFERFYPFFNSFCHFLVKNMTFHQTTKEEKHNNTKNDKNRHFLAFLSIFEHF